MPRRVGDGDGDGAPPIGAYVGATIGAGVNPSGIGVTGAYVGAGIGVTAYAVGAVTGTGLYVYDECVGCDGSLPVETLRVDGFGCGVCAKPASFGPTGPGVIDGSGFGWLRFGNIVVGEG